MPKAIVVIAHNIRSAHNVGSILRSADGLGVDKVYLTGYSPYPRLLDDGRLPHLAAKIDKQICKTSLGAEKSVRWEYQKAVKPLLHILKTDGYLLAGLEQTKKANNLTGFKPTRDVALVLGSEVGGIDRKLLGQMDVVIQIPMSGKKDSFNVSVAAAIAIYHLRYIAQ